MKGMGDDGKGELVDRFSTYEVTTITTTITTTTTIMIFYEVTNTTTTMIIIFVILRNILAFYRILSTIPPILSNFVHFHAILGIPRLSCWPLLSHFIHFIHFYPMLSTFIQSHLQEYLDSLVGREDLLFLGEAEVARTIVELGYRFPACQIQIQIEYKFTYKYKYKD